MRNSTKLTCIAVLLIAVLAFTASASLTIVQPVDLSAALGELSYSLANYGNTPYGTTFYGTAVFSDPVNGCGDINYYTPQSGGNSTDISDDNDAFGGNQVLGSFTSPIFMIERSGCAFVTKSRNAQEANGKVVIIYDNKLGEGVNDIIMMDQSDHSGKGLMVSTLFIQKSSADQMKAYLTKNPKETIVLKIVFNRPIGRAQNKIKFWMSAMHGASYDFLKNFYSHYIDLKDNGILMEFSPHYITQQDKDIERQKKHCLSNGKYCSPEIYLSGSDVFSRDLVLEDLKQIVIFQQSEDMWWQYVLLFAQDCVSPQVKNIADCSNNVLLAIGASEKQIKIIDSEVDKSFVRSNGSSKIDVMYQENTLLAREAKKQYDQAASMIPTLIFNGEYFRGDIQQESAIYEFICSGFDVKPQSCFDSYHDWIAFMNKKYQRETQSQSSSFWSIAMFVVLILLSMFVVFFCYRRGIKKEMQADIGAQVNMAVTNYFMLNDTKN